MSRQTGAALCATARAAVETAILDYARLLWIPGAVYELRVPNAHGPQGSGTVSGYYDSVERFAAAAAHWNRRAPGVYATLNPVKPEVLTRSSNRWQERARQTTSDADIACRTWLPLDFDPVRPAGMSSTEEEHELALERARQGRALLIELGFDPSDLILADSGNGAHLLGRVELPNTDQATALIRGCIESVAERLADSQVEVDRTTYNASRIWKVYGTTAAKGPNQPDRPWRTARLLNPEKEQS